MSLCPCGSKKNYEQCCGVFIEKKQTPETPEQLMRSRYSAYSQAKIEYIKNSMKGKPFIHFNESEAKKWAQSVTWTSLKIIKSNMETPDKGYVEFVANYKEHGQLKKIHEISEFQLDNGIWFYTDGKVKELIHNIPKPKIARNGPCHCGSGKKFKNCHDK